MTDFDELIDNVVYESRNWLDDDEPINKAVKSLTSAIAELQAQLAERNETVQSLSGELANVTKRANELYAQLAEAEADADRLAKELHDWLVFAEANDQIYAARSGMNAMLHHQKRKEGK